MAANIQKRGKSETLSDVTFPSVLVFFYMFVRLSTQEGSPLDAQWCWSSPIPPLWAQKSCCPVISSNLAERTHYVWLSSCSQEVTNGGFFHPWSCFTSTHPISNNKHLYSPVSVNHSKKSRSRRLQHWNAKSAETLNHPVWASGITLTNLVEDAAAFFAAMTWKQTVFYIQIVLLI